jgi:hypothetical protein
MQATTHNLQLNSLKPRQILFWSSYLQQDTQAFGNAYKSAKIAGYTEETAKNITRKDWFRDGKDIYSELLEKAEENMLHFLTMETKQEIIYQGNRTGIYQESPELIRIKSDISKFICMTLGRDTYNTKQNRVLNHIPQIPEHNTTLKDLFR